jgi:hypothetical protein
MRGYHQAYASLEQKIRREIEAKQMGVPPGISHSMAIFMEQNRFNQQGRDAWQRLLASPAYDSTLPLEENIEKIVGGHDQLRRENINRQLEDYFVPALTDGTQKNYHDLLQENYELVRTETSIKDIVTTVKSRAGGISDEVFHTSFGALCSCCGLPLSFPVCLCSLR